MRFTIILLFLSTILQAQDLSFSDVQYNVIIKSESKDAFDVNYEVRFPQVGIKKDRVFSTTSQDSFLIILFNDIRKAPPEKTQLLMHFHGMWGGRRTNFNRAYKFMKPYFLEREETDFYRMINVKWPGNKMEYRDNKKKIVEIGDPMQELLIGLIRKIQLVNILDKTLDADLDLIAHSLGNVMLKEMIMHIDQEELEYPLFKQIVLAAPDLETYDFKKDSIMQNLQFLADRSHIYFSNKDITLGISKNLNDRSRLGLDGPLAESEIPKNVFFVDCTLVKDEETIGEKMSGHSYYRSSPIATMDMLYVFKGLDLGDIPNRKVTDSKLNIFQIEYETEKEKDN